jgi:hypothetical protein
MAITLDGANGITSPGGDVASVSLATPILKSSGSLTLQTNGSTTAVTVDTSQNVGIGQTSPSTFSGNAATNLVIGNGGGSNGITLYPGATGQGTIDFASSTSGTGQYKGYLTYSTTTDTMYLGTAASTRMTIDSSGNVGIGTSSPTQRLHVYGANTAGHGQFTVQSTTASELSRMTFYNGGGSPVYQLDLNCDPTNNYVNYDVSTGKTQTWSVQGSTKMTLDSSGNLLVGTTSSLSNYDKVGVLFNGQTNYGIVLKTSYSGTGSLFAAFYSSGGSQIGSINQNATSTVAYSTSSDYRLKENIAPMTGALETVSKLKPVTYKWKSDGSDGQGFIAHELAEIVPEAVIGEKDAMRIEKYEISPAISAEIDEDGKVIKEAIEAVIGEREVPQYQGIDTSFLVATLTAAIQEQQTMIEELKAKVAALETK